MSVENTISLYGDFYEQPGTDVEIDAPKGQAAIDYEAWLRSDHEISKSIH
jgi:hypothetical protein